MSDGFNIGLDKTIDKELDNHIKIKIGSGVGWKCESNIKNDQKILYYE